MSHPEVHLGDIGTQYRVRISDEGGPFDPTDADDKILLFEMPNGDSVEREADVESDGSPSTQWYLTYTVVAADVGGSPAAFHTAVGKMRIQARLSWADGRTFSSNINTKEESGSPLRVHRNLD